MSSSYTLVAIGLLKNMLYLTLLWFGQRHWWYYENSKLLQIIATGCHRENTCNYSIKIAPVLKINQLIPFINVHCNTIEETFLWKTVYLIQSDKVRSVGGR